MLTYEDVKELEKGQTIYHALHKNVDETPQRWRVNGKVKTWKTDPYRIEVPIKRGLYETDYLSNLNMDEFSLNEDIVIECHQLLETRDDKVLEFKELWHPNQILGNVICSRHFIVHFIGWMEGKFIPSSVQ